MTCPICVYANVHGSWPPDHPGTHCRDCHRSWTGMTEAHCAVCCQHFTSDRVAELHEPYCSPHPAEVAESMRDALTKAGTPLFDTRQRKHGLTWVKFDPRANPAWVNR